DSLLNIHGESAVAHAIREVWATMYDAHAIQYLHTHNSISVPIKTALIVQKMVDAQSSGVVFTVHPRTGDKNVMVLQAIAGLGEYLKNKGVTPDLYEVNKQDLSIQAKNIHLQDSMLVKASTQNKQVPVTKKLRNTQKISDHQIVSLAEYAKKLEKHYFFPQDIEWSIEDGKIYIIETKPQTLHHEKTKELPPANHTLSSHTVRSLLIGEPVSPGIGVGAIKVVTKPSDIQSFRPGDVLVAKSTSASYEPAMRRASAIIVENGIRSSHTAYTAKQFGVPAVIGVPNACSTLKNGTVVTVKGNSGEILKGNLKLLSAYTPHGQSQHTTKTSLFVEVTNVRQAEKIATLPIDGVGALCADTIMTTYGVHPKKVVHDKKVSEYTSFLGKEIGIVAKSVYPKPVIYSLSSGSTDMYRGLHGGREYEQFTEKNTLLGYRGAFRHISDPRLLELELSVIQSVRAFGYNNVHIRIPFVRSIKEFELMRKMIHKAGFRRSATCTIWMTCTTPSNVLQIDEYITAGLDGVFIDADVLLQLVTGYDRQNSEVQHELDMLNPAVMSLYQQVITVCKKQKVATIFSTSSLSLTPDLIEKLVEWGIDTISVTPDGIHHTREQVWKAEEGK
ncbi:MAG TPA: PEP/pyruvate-binding domain-containing protein, partial [Candidatus Levybacteria bacterium]|nr:PEP/pyruvate-binding domain-containing protein [Candidatus Levybacteria bacterium]